MKSFITIIILAFSSTQIFAQITLAKDSTNKKSNLSFYHSIAPEKNYPSFQRVDYSRPKNQFMSWPSNPLSTTFLEQRNEKWKVDNALPDVIVKDIIQSLNKKKKADVVPKF